LFFFFSSRRRHTRSKRDWSSDVCSSDLDNIDIEIVEIAFKVALKLSLDSVAFDFVFDEEKKPRIVELSYGFGTTGIENVPGYWDAHLNWYEGKFNPQEWMVKLCLQEVV